jgi:HSP20 family protein
VNKENISLNVDRDMITVAMSQTNEKEGDEEKEGATFHRRERSMQYVSRSVRLPDTADMDNIDAKYEDGVLKLTIPKRGDVVAKTRSITIN